MQIATPRGTITCFYSNKHKRYTLRNLQSTVMIQADLAITHSCCNSSCNISCCS